MTILDQMLEIAEKHKDLFEALAKEDPSLIKDE